MLMSGRTAPRGRLMPTAPHSRLAYYFSVARHCPSRSVFMVRTMSSLEWMAESRPRLSDVDQKSLTESLARIAFH
jgi:hypothetical protein